MLSSKIERSSRVSKQALRAFHVLYSTCIAAVLAVEQVQWGARRERLYHCNRNVAHHRVCRNLCDGHILGRSQSRPT